MTEAEVAEAVKGAAELGVDAFLACLNEELGRSNKQFQVIVRTLNDLLLTKWDPQQALELLVSCLKKLQQSKDGSHPALVHVLLEVMPTNLPESELCLHTKGAAELFQSYCQQGQPKIMVKLAQAFHLTMDDLLDVDEFVEVVQKMLSDKVQLTSAIRLLMHFPELDEYIDKVAVLGQLVAEGLAGVGAKWAKTLDREYQVAFVEHCILQERLKSASHAVREFHLQEEFPDIEMMYKMRTLERLVDKKLWQVAVSFVGTDQNLRLYVLQQMVLAGEMPMAEEHRQQFGLPPDVLVIDQAALAAEEERRLQQYLQLQVPLEDVVFVDNDDIARSACEELAANTMIGLDVEWKPQHLGHAMVPASLLQLAGQERVFLFDLLVLNKSAVLDEGLTKITRSPDIMKLGFEVSGDLGKLASSYPHMAAFRAFHNVVDLKSLWLRFHLHYQPAMVHGLQKIQTVKDVEHEGQPTLTSGERYPDSSEAINTSHNDLQAEPLVASSVGPVGKVFTNEMKEATCQLEPTADSDLLKPAGGLGGLEATSQLPEGTETSTRLVVKPDASGGTGHSAGGKPPGLHHLPPTSRVQGVGLSTLCKVLLGKPLDKSMQVSDWEKRPLSERQVKYAAQDAHVLLRLYEELNHWLPEGLKGQQMVGFDFQAAPLRSSSARRRGRRSEGRSGPNSSGGLSGDKKAGMAGRSAQDDDTDGDNQGGGGSSVRSRDMAMNSMEDPRVMSSQETDGQFYTTVPCSVEGKKEGPKGPEADMEIAGNLLNAISITGSRTLPPRLLACLSQAGLQGAVRWLDSLGAASGTLPPISHGPDVPVLLDRHLASPLRTGDSHRKHDTQQQGPHQDIHQEGRERDDADAPHTDDDDDEDQSVLFAGAGVPHAVLGLTFSELLEVTKGRVVDIAAGIEAEVETRSCGSDLSTCTSTTQPTGPLGRGTVDGNTSTTASRVRFLLDGMLGRLCRWLRCLGVDSELLKGRVSPMDLVQCAAKATSQGRVFVTRDFKLAARRDCGAVYVLHSDNPIQQLEEVARHFNIKFEERYVMSRCSNCNAADFHLLQPKSLAWGLVPVHVYHMVDEFWQCGGCSKVFWMGPKSYKAMRLVDNLLKGCKDMDEAMRSCGEWWEPIGSDDNQGTGTDAHRETTIQTMREVTQAVQEDNTEG